MLTDKQIAERAGKLTASAIGCLMTGDQAKIMNLWRELTGDPSFVRDDLSDIWPVQLGVATEELHLSWLERKRGVKFTHRGTVHTHPTLKWAAATTDAWWEESGCPVEVKHIGGFEGRDVVRARYMPQVHWLMFCTGAKKALFSVIEGAREPSWEIIPLDEDYAAELLKRAEAFMKCVWELTSPVAQAPVEAPVKAIKTYDYTGNNEWASEASVWVANYKSAKIAAASEKTLKAMVPADAQRVHGYGIEITRNKASSLSLKEIK